MARHVEIRIESNSHTNKYPLKVAMKYLGKNGIKAAQKYNVELDDILIGHNLSISAMPLLISSLLVYQTQFKFCAFVLSDGETPVYFHPNTMENGIPPVPWGYFSHDPNPTSDGKDSLMVPDLNASDDWYDTYRSTLAGVDAVV